MIKMSFWQFAFFRIVFGVYLAVHFGQLLPWVGELFGVGGVMGDPSLNPAYGAFPNPLNFAVPDWVLVGIAVGLVGCSVCFAMGLWRKPMACLLWFGWTAFFHRNNLISNPSIPYVGLLLVLSILVPGGEPLSRGKRNGDWGMPRWVFRTAWILMAVGYTFSGVMKLSSPSWVDGSAMRYLLENPLARPGVFRDLMLWLPDGFLAAMTWGVLAVEVFFLPLVMWSRSRLWVWLAMVGMHLGIMAVVDFADLSLGMLMIHLFTFDPRWMKSALKVPGRVRFDGECLMCDGFIRFLAEEDGYEMLRFCALDTEPGEGAPKTILFESEGVVFQKSDAVLRMFGALGGQWRVLAMTGGFVPRFLRDACYDFVARHRYAWFGKADVCGLPGEELRRRLEY
ncbi:MAG: DCC1-like thiol-disulfide oxidoreductase family protein [Luteolibacter sp.]